MIPPPRRRSIGRNAVTARNTGRRRSTPSEATPPGPAARPNPWLALLSAAAPPQPFLEVEHPRAGVQPQPLQGLRRQQREVMAGGAVRLDKITPPEILDPRHVEGEHPG